MNIKVQQFIKATIFHHQKFMGNLKLLGNFVVRQWVLNRQMPIDI